MSRLEYGLPAANPTQAHFSVVADNTTIDVRPQEGIFTLSMLGESSDLNDRAIQFRNLIDIILKKWSYGGSKQLTFQGENLATLHVEPLLQTSGRPSPVTLGAALPDLESIMKKFAGVASEKGFTTAIQTTRQEYATPNTPNQPPVSMLEVPAPVREVQLNESELRGAFRGAVLSNGLSTNQMKGIVDTAYKAIKLPAAMGVARSLGPDDMRKKIMSALQSMNLGDKLVHVVGDMVEAVEQAKRRKAELLPPPN